MKTLFFLLSLSCFSIVKAQDYTGYCDFEEPCSFLRPISPDNIWEVGIPDKPVITAANSPVNCLITGATESVDSNMNEFVQFDCYVGNGKGYSTTEFYFGFYYHSDLSLDSDFVSISLSFDSSNYFSIQYLNEMNGSLIEYYEWVYFSIENYIVLDTDTGITGNSAGWEFGEILLQFYNPPINLYDPEIDTVHLRFTLISDSIDSGGDGFAIDDILLASAIYHSIEGFMYERELKIYPNPVSAKCIISCPGLSNLSQTLKLTTVHGKQIMILTELQFDASGQTEISLEGLPPGTYICTGASEDTSFKGMIVKL